MLIASAQKPIVDTSRASQSKLLKTSWSSPKKATVWALTLPGAGQLYNKKYLKAGILYAGFAGLAYMFDFNRDSLARYQAIYTAKIDGDPSTVDLYPERSEASVKSDRDFHRKYRDLSLIGFVVLYALQAIDANVDAHLKEFKLNKDLSLNLSPAIHVYQPDMGMYGRLTLKYTFK